MIKISIVGLGLIGGSIGLALKSTARRSYFISGFTRSQGNAQIALKRGAIDTVETDLKSAVIDKDMIIIATPVNIIKTVLKEISPLIKTGCIITDTASTKVKVMHWAYEYLPKSVTFVGGHPMAGKEKSGIDAADAHLFKNCIYCITLPENCSSVPPLIEELIGYLGARRILLDAMEHDRWVAAISHLPFIVSSVLVSTVMQDNEWHNMSILASSGFRDSTRLASGNTDMYKDICSTNKENIIQWMDRFSQNLEKWRRSLSIADYDLSTELKQSNNYRENWLKQQNVNKES